MNQEPQNLNIRGLTADRLRTLYYVACTQSATKAGEYLGLSQSAVTKQIQLIEDELGVMIFERRERKFILTPIGERVFELANRTLHDIDGVLKSIREEKATAGGPLRILTYPSFATIMVPRYFKNFNERYPNITLQISSTYGEMAIMDADVIIRSYIANQPEVEQLRLYQEYYGLYASPEYIKQYGEPKSLEELDRHKLLALDPNLEKIYPELNWVLKVGVAEHSHYRKAHMYFPTSDVLGLVVMQGFGIGALVNYQARIIGADKLVRILPDYGVQKEHICYNFNKNVKNRDRYLALYHFLKEQIDQDAQIFDENFAIR